MSSKYSTTSKEYHKEYYKKYRDTLKYRRDCAKNCKLSEDVIAWKVAMLGNPNCFYPFAKPFDISGTSAPLSCGWAIKNS
jgi:hypothetical protein